jgi:hypothetical protein
MFDWAKNAYAENKATGDQVIDFALGQMDKMSAWADADRKVYEDVYQPLEMQAAARAQDYASPERQEFEAGKAEADVAAQFEQARRTAAQNLEQYGVDPSQMRQGALDLGTRVAEAAGQASAGNQARFRTEMYGDQLMANAIATGRGYPAQYMSEASGASSSANQGVNTGLATTTSGANTMGTGQGWTGYGNQGVGQWGQILNAGFQNEMSKYEADQSSSSGIGSLLGTVAPIVGSFFGPAGTMAGSAAGRALSSSGWAEGGAIPDDGEYLDPSMSPSGGGIPDDIDAEMPNGGPARLNAGEFIVPQDVVKWMGEKGMQQFILKARKEMGDPNQAPAQPEVGPPPVPPRGITAIPEMEGV